MELKEFKFNKPANRPFIFSSFVSTLDGKIIVKKPGYWPIGSKNDYQFFTHLRAHADAIVDARNTAMMFGKKTIETIQSQSFNEIRSQLGKTKETEYIVITSRPDQELLSLFTEYKPYIATTAPVSSYDQSRILHLTGEKHIDLQAFFELCEEKGWHSVFIDGGPTLIAQLLQEQLIDELFITIAPKIVGSEQGITLTLAEGLLFDPKEVKRFSLVSSEQVGDEVFLRYKFM